MSMQFILGDAQSDRQAFLLNELVAQYQKQPQMTFLYLVPDHIKFESETAVLRALQHATGQTIVGSMRLQVLSFSRLAWFFLRDSGQYALPRLSRAGLMLLTRRLLLTHETALTLYRGETRQKGFIEALTDLFLELRQANIDSNDLARIQNHLSQHPVGPKVVDLPQKITELTVLYRAFCDALHGKYLEKEDLLSLLCAYLETHSLQQTSVYVAGFDRFSAQELAVMGQLMQHATHLCVSLSLPTVPDGAVRPDELFAIPAQTFQRLCRMSDALGMAAPKIRVLSHQVQQRHPQIQGLLRQWQAQYSFLEPAPNKLPVVTGERVALWSCSSKQAEVQLVAERIAQLVVEEGYRYRDIKVLTRDVSTYERIIRPIFQQYRIPFFLDNASNMAQHPLVVVLDCLQRIKQQYWRYVDVIRLLRTQLFASLCTPQQSSDYHAMVDFLENTVLAFGYEGLHHWQQAAIWQLNDSADHPQEKANTQLVQDSHLLRTTLVSHLTDFFQKLTSSNTMRDAAHALFDFLTAAHIGEQVIVWRDQAVAAGNLTLAKQQEQTWHTLIKLLDELVALFGEQPYDEAVFFTILQTGFEKAEYSLVPPSLDQVTVASIEGTQAQPVRVVLAIGLSAEQFPKQFQNTSLLTDEERESVGSLCTANQFLKPSVTERSVAEPFVAYQLFAQATDYLVLTQPLAAQQEVSLYLSLVARLTGTSLAAYQADIGYNSRFAMALVLQQAQRSVQRQEPLPPNSRAFLATALQDETLRQQWNFLSGSLQHRNTPENLRPTIANQLYAGQLHLSVSQLELYFKDPYSHFLQYGLRLKERTVQTLTAAGTGTFFHDAMDAFLSIHADRLQEVSDEQLLNAAHDVLAQLYSRTEFSLFTHSARQSFSGYLLGQTVWQMMRVLRQQYRWLPRQTLALEVPFGSMRQQDGPLLWSKPIPLVGYNALHLRGKVDRIDLLDNQWLSVVDYKSRAHRFHLQDVYYGLSLQLMVYLKVALDNVSRWQRDIPIQPLGAFYSHIHHNRSKDGDNNNEDFSSYRLNGVVACDTAQLALLDSSLLDQKSQVLHYQLKKDGSYSSSRSMPVLDAAQLRIVLDYLETKAAEAGERILSGDIRLAPFKDEAHIPSMKHYRSVSQFDATLQENQYQIKEAQQSVAELIELMAQQNQLRADNLRKERDQ